jgi:hypothetical protein
MRYELRDRGVWDTETAEHLVAGHPRWPEYEDWLKVQGNTPGPAPAPAAVTRSEALARKLSEIDEIAGSARQRITGPVSPQEMASWSVKLQQARAFTESAPETDYEMITIEAQARGVETIDIASRVISNAQAYSAAEARIAGTAGKHRDAVRALAERDDILAYDVTTDWP